MDGALKKGLQEVFKEAEDLICITHVAERDRLKLQKMGASRNNIKEIMTDIYGCQVNEYLESGLADSIDEPDFDIRLESLKVVWEDKVEGFHAWFLNKRAPLFVEQVIGSALDRLQISERFSTNRLENFHKIQKAFCEEGQCKGDAVAVLKACQKWIEFFEKEGEKAFTGQGKYRLAPGYGGFKNPRYLYWTSEEKSEHQERFRQFVPVEANTYVKPANAGLKKAKETKRRRGDSEVQIFNNRIATDVHQEELRNPSTPIEPVISTKGASAGPSGHNEDLSFLDPFREKTIKYMLVHRGDVKNCPKIVKRCQECKVVFDASDIVLIRSTGRRETTCAKTGKPTSRVGNIYLHNLMKCLTDHDSKFKYTDVVVLKQTYERLSENGKAIVLSHNMQLEK